MTPPYDMDAPVPLAVEPDWTEVADQAEREYREGERAAALTDFLLARIAEDEVVARACFAPYWRSWIEGRDGWGGDGALFLNVLADGKVADADVYGWPTDECQDHAARHDPARVLAECEAKRRIVERLSNAYECPFVALTLLDLAAAYSDHKDFNEAWRA